MHELADAVIEARVAALTARATRPSPPTGRSAAQQESEPEFGPKMARR